MMSSLKFSYWSSPHTSTTSGLKASSSARTLRNPGHQLLALEQGRSVSLIVAPFFAHGVGQFSGFFCSLGMRSFRSARVSE